MIIRLCGKAVLVSIIFPISFLAQTLQPSSQETIKIRDERQNVKINSAVSNSASQKQGTLSRQLTFVKQKRNKDQQKQLLPNAGDLNRYAEFLRLPKTGLIRLTNDIGCNSNALILRADEECLKSIPGGSFYSFREREYSSSALADLRLKDGLLITDGVFSQNILVRLGDIPLEKVSVDSDGMEFLTKFLPESDVKEATKQYIKITRGIRIGKFEYSKVFPSSVNTTYALRLVAYKGKIMRRNQGFIYDALSEDDRSDVLVAFRIVRKENDGITLIWKELERKKSPKIKTSN